LRTLIPVLALALGALAQDPPAPAPAPPPAPAVPKAAEDDPVVIIQTSMGDIRVRLFKSEAPKTVENFLALAEGAKEWKDSKTGNMVKRPFYDGLVFHRVIKGFMIQGGCPRGDGTGDPGYKFDDEISAKGLGLDTAKALVNGKPPHPSLQVQEEADMWRNVYGPLMAKMGIRSQEELDKRKAEVEKKVTELTVKEALENLGYVYVDNGSAHEPKKGSLAMANSGPNTNGSQFYLNLADTPWLAGRHTVFGEVVLGMDVLEKIGDVKVGPAARPVADVRILSIRLAPAGAEKPVEAPKPDAPPAPPK